MSESAPSAPSSPILPFVVGAAAAAAIAALACRLFTSGGGTELFQPGAQLLFDSLALCAAAFTALARLLRNERPLRSSGRALLPLAALVVVLGVGASRAPTPDLGWRTACSATALLLLALSLRDLGDLDPRVGRACLAALLGCVVGGALLALYNYFVEIPRLQAKYFAGGLDAELSGLDRSMAIAFDERVKSRQAVGPFLLPGLAATILAAGLAPLALIAWQVRRKQPRLAALLPLLLTVGLALALTKSKGAIVTVVGVSCVFALLHPGLQRYRRRLFLLAGAGALLLAAVGIGALALGPERIGVGLSLTVRMEYWEAGLRMWRAHPLLGVGLNGFRDWFPLMKSVRAEETAYAHNAVVQLLADLGLVGLGAAAVLALAWVWGPVAAAARGEPAADPDEREPVLGGRGLWLALGTGLVLGLVLVAGFGDAYDASKPLPLVTAFLVAGAASAALVWALRAGDGDPRALRAALLAGAAALLFDGLLSFGLDHAGTFALTTALAALAPALGGGPPDPPRPLWAHRLAGAVPLLLAPALLLAIVPGAIAADQSRAFGVDQLTAAASGKQPGPHVVAAVEAFDHAAHTYPYHARTWLNLAGALRTLARLRPERREELMTQALAAARQAVARAPRAPEARRELADLLRRRDPEAALEALDAAVALYPGHPGLLLAAGKLRVELLQAGRDGPQGRAARRARARQDLEGARTASETTRLVRRRLSPAQLETLRRLLDALGTD